MHFSLRQLTLFQAVARHLSYTRAAQELHLTPPTVSLQIKQLEDSLGLPLFEQLGKKMYLTYAGEEMLRYAQDILQQVTEAQQLMDDLKDGGGGRLKLALSTTANYCLPRLLAIFKQRWADMRLRLEVTHRAALLKHLYDNDVDMVIMGKPPEALEPKAFEWVAEAFMENPLVMIAPPEHPLVPQPTSETFNAENNPPDLPRGGLATAEQLPLKALVSHSLLLRERGAASRLALERCFQQQALTLSSDIEMHSDEAIKQGVQAGLGLGLVSRHSVAKELATGSLVMLSVDAFPMMHHWYLVHRQGKRLSALAAAFRQFLLAEAKQHF